MRPVDIRLRAENTSSDASMLSKICISQGFTDEKRISQNCALRSTRPLSYHGGSILPTSRGWRHSTLSVSDTNTSC